MTATDPKIEAAKRQREDARRYLRAIGQQETREDGSSGVHTIPGHRYTCGCFVPDYSYDPLKPCDRHRRALLPAAE